MFAFRWYDELIPRPAEKAKFPGDGPAKINLLRRSAQTLLRLKWDGYPLYYDDDLGWGYLVPGKPPELKDHSSEDIEEILKKQLEGTDTGEQQFSVEEELRQQEADAGLKSFPRRYVQLIGYFFHN